MVYFLFVVAFDVVNKRIERKSCFSSIQAKFISIRWQSPKAIRCNIEQNRSTSLLMMWRNINSKHILSICQKHKYLSPFRERERERKRKSHFFVDVHFSHIQMYSLTDYCSCQTLMCSLFLSLNISLSHTWINPLWVVMYAGWCSMFELYICSLHKKWLN